jgi:hypothetical protein
MKKPKEFVSSDREEIEAELLRLMRDPKCYAISTIELDELVPNPRNRILYRENQDSWVALNSFGSQPLALSCFSYTSKNAKCLSRRAGYFSSRERTLIVGWFA